MSFSRRCSGPTGTRSSRRPTARRPYALLAGGFHDLVVMDIRMPGMDGIAALERVKEMSPRTGVVMMTAYASVETAVKAMKLGAFDYVTKPIDIDEVRAVVARFIESIDPTESEELPVESRDVVGASEALRAVLELAHRVAASDATVLLSGESGTGKEVMARDVHSPASRRDKPFVAVNCAALSETLLESELFGHEKGSFTGAVERRSGQVRARATAAPSSSTRSATCRRRSRRSSSASSRSSRLRARRRLERRSRSTSASSRATNRDLEREVAEGSFREDLYYRLNVVTITVPPLRERPEDVPLLAEHFLQRSSLRRARNRRRSRRAPCGS